MSGRETKIAAPARARVGLPILADGSRRHPVLLALDGDEGACNNGCPTCLSRPTRAEATPLAGRHVVIRHREATLRRDLARHVAAIAAQGPASLQLLTNGRLLAYPKVTDALVRAGVDRFVVKLFGLDAASHDAHTRAEGSFDQALAGIAAARDRVEVVVTFPLEPDGDPAARRAIAEARRALARTLTDREPVSLPEPEVEGHANEFRYDVVVLRDGVKHRFWTESFLPMVHVNTGPLCNIKCLYCNVHGGDDQRLYDRAYVEELVDRAAAHVLPKGPGASVDFIGGEPTMHPDLPALIAHARKAGFGKVYICTNGVRLTKPGYLDELVAAGLTGVRFSFHEHRPEVANRLADVAGLGDRYVEVAKLLLTRTDLHVHLYRILLAETLDAVPDYLRFLHAHNRTGKPLDLTFGMPSMRGRLHENRALYPPLEGLREKVAAALAVAAELGIEPLVHHAPGCLDPAMPERHAALHVRTLQLDALAASETLMNFEGDARYGKACEGCAGKGGGCHGLPAAYWDADPAAAEAWLRPTPYVPA